MFRVKSSLLLSLLLLGLVSLVSQAKSAITLVYFIATVEQEDTVFLEWETGSEADISGFYVVRSTSLNGIYNRVGELIFAAGEFGGAYYNYTDEGLTPNIYFYKLEIVPLDQGQASEFTDPVSVTIGNVPTQTTTATQSITATIAPTKTGTQFFPTLTTTLLTSSATITRSPTTTITSTRTNTPRPVNTQQAFAATRTRTPTGIANLSTIDVSITTSAEEQSTATLPPLILPSSTSGPRQWTQSAAQTQTAIPTPTPTATFSPRQDPPLRDVLGWGGVILGACLFLAIGSWIFVTILKHNRLG
jgi:hypothetical protein